LARDFTNFRCGMGLCVDVSNTVFATTGSGTILQINPTGVVTLFAGRYAGYNDGPRLNALFFLAFGDMEVDNLGNIYVSDYDRIRKIDSSGWVSTLAGSTVSGFIDGNGRSARFNTESGGLCADSHGNIFVADYANNAIRKISAGSGGAPSL